MERVTTAIDASRLGRWIPAAGRILLLLMIGTLVILSQYAAQNQPGEGPNEMTAAIAPPAPENRTPTDREINRLCRSWAALTPSNQLLSWQAGWEGPLGDIAAQAGLTFDWRCHVADVSSTKGILCRTRPNGPVRYRLHTPQVTGRIVRQEAPIEKGDILALQGIRHALAEQNGVVVHVAENCTLDVIIGDERYLRVIQTRADRRDEHAAR
jgi:hypothetical protein